ncbi:unnamed protein product, partial [Rotaria magnacalcarata]
PLSPRMISESDNHPIEELSKTPLSKVSNKRKHSTNSLSPISNTPSVVKKRAKNELQLKKQHSKLNNKKRKESLTEDDPSDDHKQMESTADKRRFNLDLSSKYSK